MKKPSKRSKLPPMSLLTGTFYYDAILGALCWKSDDLALVPPPHILMMHGDKPRRPMEMGLPSGGRDRAFFVHDVLLRLSGAELPDCCLVDFRDGNPWNTNLMNLKVVLPGKEEHDFGWKSSVRKGGNAIFIGEFPTTNNQFAVLMYQATCEVDHGEDEDQTYGTEEP